ncbi:MAG: hypothetical protein J7525_19770 [Roseofilum sp. SID3]|uniref:hypothetical protein n=1 Tax=Roseofilum sp. SID3 TaxID=2821499 RepID=UPI001B21EE82|nr:hypothetical protein [Roseofilum sp. SID3]MBP0015335.1 hypothetical protein [Roseofilum sp. SID3]
MTKGTAISILASALILSSCTQPDGNSRHCLVKSVDAGDQVTLICDGQPLEVELCGIDTPSPESEEGERSLQHLQELISQGEQTEGITQAILFNGNEIFIPIEGEEELEIHLGSQMVFDGYAQANDDQCLNPVD